MVENAFPPLRPEACIPTPPTRHPYKGPLDEMLFPNRARATRRRHNKKHWLLTSHLVVARETDKNGKVKSKTFRLPPEAAEEDCNFDRKKFVARLRETGRRALTWLKDRE